MDPKYISSIEQIDALSDEEKRELVDVTKRYPFYANEYYLNLIDWDDPKDPIRRIIIPDREEMDTGGSLDPSDESLYTVSKGVEHKYDPTVLILSSGACGGFCRFCFRKRIFHQDNTEICLDLDRAIDYIKRHEEIENILLSGGDPFALHTDILENLLDRLGSIGHIKYIRIGTKIPVYNPYRILDDPELVDMIDRFSIKERKIHIITNINHPRELTPQAMDALNLLLQAGAVIMNQTPLLRGVNDDSGTLKELFRKLTAIGVSPYYVFQCRPTLGNRSFIVPIEEGYSIFEGVKADLSGPAKRARFIMSHTRGKLEITALTESKIIFKFHNAADEDDRARVLVFKRNPKAEWLDDYEELIETYKLPS